MTEFVVTRVVIACDAVADNLLAIEAAAELAAAMKANLRGIFLQDEALLHVAALPFVRHVSASGAVSSGISESTISHQLEAHADRVRTAIEGAARTHAVNWSFEVVRGQPNLVLLSVGERDLLVIEAGSRPFIGQFRLDSRILATAFESGRSVLLVRSQKRDKDNVIALLQLPGTSLDRVLAAAAELAASSNRRLIVVIANPAIDAKAVTDVVRRISPSLGQRTAVTQPSRARPVLEEFASENSLLVIDADPAANDISEIKEIARQTRADLLLLR